MKLSVLGWYGRGNIGDEAYKLAFPLLFPQHGVRCLDRIRDDGPDAVILGGGDVVYADYTHRLSGVPVPRYAMSVTLTSRSDFDFLQQCTRVYVRDDRSLSLARERELHVPLSYLPDFTFALTPSRMDGRDLLRRIFAEEDYNLKDNIVVCVINSYIAFGRPESLVRDFGTFLKVSHDIARVADQLNASCVFLPFGVKAPADDRTANAWVASHCKLWRKNLVIYDRLSVQDTLDIIAAADAVISTRFHSTVFSTLAGVPFVDLTHHDKNRGFLETLGKTDWSLPLWDFSGRQLQERLETCLGETWPNHDLSAFTNSAKDQLANADLL